MSDDIGQVESDVRMRVESAIERGVDRHDVGEMLMYLSDEYRDPNSTDP